MLRHESRKNTQNQGESKVTRGHQSGLVGLAVITLGTIKGSQWTDIYEAPTRLREPHSCCRRYKDESDLDPALQGFTMMQEPWSHFSCNNVLMRPVLKTCIQCWSPLVFKVRKPECSGERENTTQPCEDRAGDPVIIFKCTEGFRERTQWKKTGWEVSRRDFRWRISWQSG